MKSKNSTNSILENCLTDLGKFPSTDLLDAYVIKPRQIETESPIRMLSVKMPAGRDFKELVLWEDNLHSEVIESKFELCKYIKDYEAIWSPSLGFIECELNRGTLCFPSTVMLRRLSI